MEATILGSGSPLPLTSRGGQSMVVTVDDDPILIDCGPLTVERLLEHGIALRDLETVAFSHHHVDHNASFFQFAVTSWMYGRESLTVFGPEGTESLLAALEEIYSQDWAYREKFGRDLDAITNIDRVRATDSLAYDADDWTLTAHAVDHAIETYAYRITERSSDASVVYAADTRKVDSLADFAADADVLVYSAAITPPSEPSGRATEGDRNSWRQYRHFNPEPTENPPFRENHSSPREAGELAEEAGVKTLVLTHHLPSRDLVEGRRQAERAFSGEVFVANDGFEIGL